MEKWSRTRQLIELGSLVQKSGLAAVTDHDLASLYGAMLDLAEYAQDAKGAATLTAWRRRGEQAFDTDAENAATADFNQG